MSEIEAPTAPRDKGGREGGARKRRETRWLEILDAAATVFHEKGYSAATLQDIADKVGMLKGSLYYYIKTKPDLLESLLVQVHEDGLAMVQASACVQGNPLDKLAAIFRAYIDYIIENQTKSAIYIHEVQRLPAQHRNRILRDHALRNEVQALIEAGQAEALVLGDLDPRLTAQVLLSGLNSIYQWYRVDRKRPKQTLIEHIVRTTLRGIASSRGLDHLEPSRPVAG